MKQINFYSTDVSDELVLNRFTYKGKGRPKKSDYTPFEVVLKMHNQKLNEYFNKLILNRKP